MSRRFDFSAIKFDSWLLLEVAVTDTRPVLIVHFADLNREGSGLFSKFDSELLKADLAFPACVHGWRQVENYLRIRTAEHRLC